LRCGAAARRGRTCIFTSTSEVHDGQSKNFSLIAGSGVAAGKGNVTAYLEYRHARPVLGGSRDFTACQLTATPNGPNVCGGSQNSNYFRVNGTVFSVVGNQLVPPQAGSSPPTVFNSNPYLNLAREDERYNAGFMAHVDYFSWLKPYFDFSFMEDRSTSDVAPSGLFSTAASVPIHCRPMLWSTSVVAT
jgi:iron complex outermembrane recepter protein